MQVTIVMGLVWLCMCLPAQLVGPRAPITGTLRGANGSPFRAACWMPENASLITVLVRQCRWAIHRENLLLGVTSSAGHGLGVTLVAGILLTYPHTSISTGPCRNNATVTIFPIFMGFKLLPDERGTPFICVLWP